MMIVERIIDVYQRWLFKWYYRFTKMARWVDHKGQSSIQRQGNRPSGQRFLDKYHN